MKRIHNKGFTLIELALVTLLVLILAGLSAPLFRNTLSDLSARNASFSICKLINYAQEMSVLERKNYRLALDAKKNNYQLLELALSETPPVYKKASGRFGRAFGMPQGITLSSEKNGIVFYPDGHCDKANIKVLSRRGGYSIEVKGFGNMVEIKNIDAEQ